MSRKPGQFATVICMSNDLQVIRSSRFVLYMLAPVHYLRHMGHIRSTAFRLLVPVNLLFLLSSVCVCLWGESGRQLIKLQQSLKILQTVT